MTNALTNFLLRKMAPLPEDYASSGPSLEELQPSYHKWRFWRLVLFLTTTVPCAIGWWLLLQEIATWNSRRYEPAIHHLQDSGVLLGLPALLLGFVTAGLMLTFMYRWLLGQRYAEFVRYDNLCFRYDHERLICPIVLGASGLSILGIAALLSWHIAFRDDRVAFHSWCGLGNTTKLYSEVRDIRTAPRLRAPSGNLVDRREYLVEFDDGTTWSTNFVPGRLDPRAKQQLLAFVAKRAKKPIRELKELE